LSSRVSRKGKPARASATGEPVTRKKAKLAVDEDGPEVSVVEGPVGRETLALIADLARPMRDEQSTLDYGDRIENAPGAKTPSRAPIAAPRPSKAELAVFEMITFVVQGADVATLASEAQRRRFVAEHLIRRLPVKNLDQVERVDVTPWTVQDTVVVRVWCKG